MEICNLTPDALDESDLKAGKLAWHEQHFDGSWEAGFSAGGCRNYLGMQQNLPPNPKAD